MSTTVEVIIEGRDNFSGTLGNFGSIMTGIESAVRLAGDAMRAFGGFAMEGLEAIAGYERLEASLTSLVASQMLQAGTAEDIASAYAAAGIEAAGLVEWNEQLAINSPFTSEGVANAFRTAMAYGFTTDEAKRLTEAMIDFAAGSGASEAAMGSIALALGQIEARGKLSGQEIMQLTNAGLPAMQILADAFGVTTAEIVAMQEKGLIPATDAVEAFTNYMETNFAGAAERQATTWAGLMGTFEDLKQMGLREFFGGLFEVIQPLAVEFATWLQGPGMERLAEWGSQLGNFTSQFVDMATAIRDGGSIGQIFSEAFGGVDWEAVAVSVDNSLADLINSIDWNSLGDKFGIAIANVFSNSNNLPTSALSAIGNAISEFMIGAMGYISWNQLGQALSDSLTDYFLNFFRVDAIQSAWEQIGADIAAGLARGITFDNMRNNISTFVDNVVNYFKQLLGIASPSTVFADIGRNIVLGLMAGFLSMVNPLIAIIDSVVSAILGPFDPILQLLGIDTTGDGSTGGRVVTGPTSPTSPTPTTGGGTIVNQYFSGATINVGSWDEIAYDCVYPNPFLQATGGGGAGGTTGGGTGRPR